MSFSKTLPQDIESLRANLMDRLPEAGRYVPEILGKGLPQPMIQAMIRAMPRTDRKPGRTLAFASLGLAAMTLALSALRLRNTASQHPVTRETIARWEDEGGTVHDPDALADMRPQAAAKLSDAAAGQGGPARVVHALHATEQAVVQSARHHPALALTLTAGAGALIAAALLRRRN